jgi:O-antigen/teichoic acid export membrane protein
MSLKSQGIKAFYWDFLGKISLHGVSLIITIILARLLEPSDFGLIAMIMVVVVIAGIFSDIGLGGALIQRRRVLQIHYSSVFFFNITVGLFLTLLSFFSASWIANFYGQEELESLIEVVSTLFFITSLSAVQNVILRKTLNYQLITKINVLASLYSGVTGIVLAYFGTGVWSLVAQIILREVFINILIWKKTSWVPSFSFSFKALKQLWRYGFNMFLAGVIDTVYEKIDYMIIGKLFTPAILGFFHQAKQLNMFVVKYSSGSLMSVLFPVLSKIQKDKLYFQTVFIKTLGIICFVTFLLLGELYLVSEELIVGLFGEKWAPSVIYFKILALSGFAYPISALMVNVISSRGKSGKFLKLEIYKKVIQSVNLYVLFMYGVEAFLYGLIVVSVLGTLLNIKFAADEIDLRFFKIVKPIIIQALITSTLVLSMSVAMQDLDLNGLLSFFIKSTLFFTAYVAVNWRFKIKSFEFVKEQLFPIINSKIRKV